MNDSLGGYIDKLLNEVNEVKALQEAVSELRTEVRELKDMITNTHHQWWRTYSMQKQMMDDVDETLAASAAYVNPEYLTDQTNQ